jgi:hypothetical protein
MLKISLSQQDTRGEVSIVHWIEASQVAVSTAIAYRKQIGTSEIQLSTMYLSRFVEQTTISPARA